MLPLPPEFWSLPSPPIPDPESAVASEVATLTVSALVEGPLT